MLQILSSSYAEYEHKTFYYRWSHAVQSNLLDEKKQKPISIVKLIQTKIRASKTMYSAVTALLLFWSTLWCVRTWAIVYVRNVHLLILFAVNRFAVGATTTSSSSSSKQKRRGEWTNENLQVRSDLAPPFVK